jgi:hypothetical protein
MTSKRYGTDLERFNRKVRVGADGCLYWTGAKDTGGYGSFRYEGRAQLAHRVVYEWVIGPIPDGLTVDHLCRHRDCVNTDHMELVSQRDNALRGESPNAQNHRKTHCIRGHPFDDENTIRHDNGQRTCKACNRIRGTAWMRKKRSRE